MSSHPKTLLVTNDFPPRPGGIQSYLESFVGQLDPQQLVVLASRDDVAAARSYDASCAYRVVRHPTRMLLPTPDVARRMRHLIAREAIETVWFGAAFPLGLLARDARAAGVKRIIASTHGHEIGWCRVPVGRSLMRRVASEVDVLTDISDFTRTRLQRHLPADTTYARLPGGVDLTRFSPDEEAQAHLRDRHDLAPGPLVVCVSRLVPRKGQDMLLRVWPSILTRYPTAHLLLVGAGPSAGTLQQLIGQLHLTDHVTLTGAVPAAELPRYYAGADIFAMPARTRAAGFDVEGLGIAYLEAAACGVPVIAGNSGGAPEALLDTQTGLVIDGRDRQQLTTALYDLLGDAERRRRYGQAGRDFVTAHYHWDHLGARLRALLSTP